MPSINMIAPRRAEKSRLERDMRRLVIVIVVEILFAVGLGAWVTTKIFTTRSHIAELDMQINEVQPTIKRIDEFKAATNKLEPKVSVLNQAKAGTMQWYDTLDTLTQTLPATMWLTRLSTAIDKQSEALTLNLCGISESQAKVGEAMMRLGFEPEFKDVSLHFTRKTAVGFATAVEFEIGVGLTSPSKDKQKEVAASGTGQS